MAETFCWQFQALSFTPFHYSNTCYYVYLCNIFLCFLYAVEEMCFLNLWYEILLSNCHKRIGVAFSQKIIPSTQYGAGVLVSSAKDNWFSPRQFSRVFCVLILLSSWIARRVKETKIVQRGYCDRYYLSATIYSLCQWCF